MFDPTNACGAEPLKYAPNSGGLNTVEWLQWNSCRLTANAAATQPSIIDRSFPDPPAGTFPEYHAPSTMSKIFDDPTLTAAVMMGLIFIAAILVISFVAINAKTRKDDRNV